MPTSYGMRDPLADLNARLRKLGLQPISMGGAPRRPDIAAMYQRPISKASPVETQQALVEQAKSSGPMYNQLTPEAEEGVLEKIGGGLLSGVEWVGKTLDSVTGARAIRGVLGGNFREALSAGPLGFFSDTIGLTDPKDIIGGRELMEKAGILEENKPGLDWGDVGGFAAEVLLDPSTYFFGAGLATKGVSASTKIGKALNKVGVLDDVLRSGTRDPKLLSKFLAGKSDDVSKNMLGLLDDAGGAVPKTARGRSAMMGQRQLGRRLDLHDILRVDDELTDMITRSGKSLPDEVQSLKSSFRGLSGRSVRDTLTESLEGTGTTLDDLLKLKTKGGEFMPLTSHWAMGFPTLFTGEKGTKGIRQSFFGNLPETVKEVAHRKQYYPGLDTKFGALLDRQAGRFDVAGEVLRYSGAGRGLATVFNSDLKWNARSAEAQKAILAKVSRFDRHVAEQQTVLHSIASKWRKDSLFDEARYTAPLEQGGLGLEADKAVELINKHMDEMLAWQEGYSLRFSADGMPISSLPEYDINSAGKLGEIATVNHVKAGNYLNSIRNQISYLTKKATPEEGADRIRNLEILGGQAEEMHKVYGREVETLRKITEPKDIGNAIDRLKAYEKKFHNVDDYGAELKEFKFGDTSEALKAFGVKRPTFAKPLGGVHNRVNPTFSSEFQDSLKGLGGLGQKDPATNLMGIEGDLVRLKGMADEAMQFAQKSGIDIGDLEDEWALYRPRSVTDPRPRGFMGAIEKARANKDIKNRIDAAAKASSDKGTGAALENLNPLTYRAKQRRDYLTGVFGGTTTLNYFYNKLGSVDFPRIQGNRSIPNEVEEQMLNMIAKDSYWDQALQNKEHFDSLIDNGILKKAEVTDTGEFVVKELHNDVMVDVPVGESRNVAQPFDAHNEVVYIDMESPLVKKFSESILAKDSEAVKQGTKLFSVDPIRSMVGYYGDVIKAANAAEIMIDVASENAYFKMSSEMLKKTSDIGGSQHTIAHIFSSSKLNTTIAKRNFIERLKAERPDEWGALVDIWTLPLEQLDEPLRRPMQNLRAKHPEFKNFLENGSGELQVGDIVASDKYPAHRGWKVVGKAHTDTDGRQIIQQLEPDPGPTPRPTEPIDHSPNTPSPAKETPSPVSETPSPVSETPSPKLPLGDENVAEMRDVIASLRKGGNKLEDRADLENIFEESGVLTFERSRDANVDKRMASNVDTWQARRANELEEMLNKKLAKAEEVEMDAMWTTATKQIDEAATPAVDSPTNKIATLEKELSTKRSRVSDGIQKRIKYLEEWIGKYKIKAEMYKNDTFHAWEAKEYSNKIKENVAEIRRLQDELSEIRNPDLTSVVSPREKALLKKYRGATGIDSDIQSRIDMAELKKEILEAKEAPVSAQQVDETVSAPKGQIVPAQLDDQGMLFTPEGSAKSPRDMLMDQAMEIVRKDSTKDLNKVYKSLYSKARYQKQKAAKAAKAAADKFQGKSDAFIDQAADIPGFGRPMNIKPAPLKDEPLRLGHTPDTVSRSIDDVYKIEPPTPVEPPMIKGPGRAGTQVKFENDSQWYNLDDYEQLHSVPNHILDNEEFSEELLRNFIIEPELADDLKRYLDSFTKRDITNELEATVDWFTNSFKDLATSLWPAFHFRNFVSGQVNNMYSGAYDPEKMGIMKWVQPVKDAMLLAQGKAIKGLQSHPMFKGMSDEQISQAIVDAAIGWGLVGPGQHSGDFAGQADDLVNNFLKRTGGPNPVVGIEDTSYLRGAASRTKAAGGIGDEVVGAVGKYTVPGFTNSKGVRGFTGYKRMGFQLGNEVEWLNRISPLVAHLRKGLSIEEAVMKVKLAQVDYKALTPWEKNWFKKVIPFYTFTRRQVPFVLENISDPSSGMSQMAKTMFRTKDAMDDPNDPTPDWISHGVNLPLHKLGLGGSQPGMARYMTGLGGMIGGAEDVMGLISPGHSPLDTAGRTMGKWGAKLNPLAQVPVEMMTGVSLFHQRPFADMNSSTARLLGEVTGSEFVPKYPSAQLDMLLQRIPGYGRGISTARTLMDRTRRPIIDEEGNFSVGNLLARTVPAGTGMKVHDTDIGRIKNRLLQGRLEEILSRNPNMVKFSQIYIPEDKLGALSQEEREAYMLYKKLGSEASKASRARKKAAEYSN